jgi:hypothetical protein
MALVASNTAVLASAAVTESPFRRVRRLSLRALALTAATLALGACATTASEPVDVGMKVSWLDQPSGTLPDSVTSISITVFTGDEDETGLEAEYTVANLPDDDGDGRPDRTLKGLPTGVPIRITLLGYDDARTPIYTGRLGPFVLDPGQRRFLDVQMYPLTSSLGIADTTLTGRFLHTSTPLPDGRVLIAGGFTAIRRVDPCPMPFPAEAHCFAATATRETFVFSPGTGRFFPAADPLAEARGGHTATALPDGRVLVAGGASEALVAFTPIGDPTAPRGWAPSVLAQTTTGSASARATFEVFDPERNAEESDADRDGDDGRGGFVGAADDPTRPGRLNGPRFLHAAASVPGTGLVLLAGGANAEAASTYEVYDDRRAGGYGVYPNDGATLLAGRSAPSAIGVGSGATAKVWIVGGRRATSNTELAEIWSPPTSSAPNGTLVAATSTGFPGMSGMSSEERPEFSTLRPELAVVGSSGSHLLAVGWLGPICAESMTAPVFAGTTGGVEELCPPGMPERSFTTRLSGGATIGTAAGSPHALGASARLDDGSFVVTGGVGNLVMTAQSAVDRFTGNVMADRAVRESGGTRMVSHRAGRALHASAALPGSGVLTTGGVVFTPDTTSATLVMPAAEALFFPAF